MGVVVWLAASLTLACPFCTTPHPSLAERREEAAVVAVAESLGAHVYRVHQVLKGADRLAADSDLTIDAAGPLAAGTLAMLFGTSTGNASPMLAWSVAAANETALGYFAQAPTLRHPAAERLVYFVPYLEHADPLIAADAYAEFGRAPFDAVESIADRLDMPVVADWLVAESVPEDRKGLYGLLLGLATDDDQRAANAAVLRRIIEQPASDFRAGFDGVLGGYLLAAGEPGLELIEKRLLADADAPRGDVLHAMTALRFYERYGHDIPRERLAQALAHVLERPEFAAPAVVDLARWQAWSLLPRVVALFQDERYADGPTDRAVVGYLVECPLPEADAALAELRKLAPQRVQAAERAALAPATDR